MRKIVIILVAFLLFNLNVKASPVLSFQNRNAIKFDKTIKVGEVELLEFAKPVSLAHYGTSKASLEYIELEKLEPSARGYKKFMLKAKQAGTGELTFRAGQEIIKVRVRVIENYDLLENQLNRLFGVPDADLEERIRVVSANLVSDLNKKDVAHVYLHGQVDTAKNALLAVAFAANALGDHGVKIFSNPGGQLRFKDLDSNNNSSSQNPFNQDDSSFVEYYESANKLIDTNNIYRDLILASENERVISFIKVKEPKRYAVKVRFLEMDSRHVDDFLNTVTATTTGQDLKGSFASADLPSANVSRSSTGLGAGSIVDAIGTSGISRLTDFVPSGSLASGAVKLLDNAFLNVNLNNLLQEGILKVVNEFSLITHSGETVSLGKGTRFPIPRLNNSIGQSSITVEYIPIGFKGELKVTGLENSLIDVQLASRLSSAEASATTIQGISIPIFNEEYVNSGALLSDGNEVVLNAFMTETETVARSSSFLGKLIPFLGRRKSKQKSKSLLFIALAAEEIEPSSQHIAKGEFRLPHLDMREDYNIYADYNRKLRGVNITDSVDIKSYNNSKKSKSSIKQKLDAKIDPLEIEGLEL